MALRNLYNRNTQAFSMNDAEITHALTLKEDSYEVKHELNPSTGHYTVKNKLGNKIMEFDNNLLLKPSALHSHIQQKEMALSDRINAHNTRITNAEDAIDGHNTRLTDAETAIANLTDGTLDNITHISAETISVTTASIDGVQLSNISGNLHTDGMSALAMTADAFYGDAGPYRFGLYNESEYILSVFQHDNVVRSHSNAALVGFSTITTLQNRCDALESRCQALEDRNVQLNLLITRISQCLHLEDGYGNDFDYSSLLN